MHREEEKLGENQHEGKERKLRKKSPTNKCIFNRSEKSDHVERKKGLEMSYNERGGLTREKGLKLETTWGRKYSESARGIHKGRRRNN